jgi:hypothetical protein
MYGWNFKIYGMWWNLNPACSIFCRLRHRCAAINRAQAPAVAAPWKKDDFEFLCFAAKTVGCAAKW